MTDALATKYAGNDKSNPNCVGENFSPPLAWHNPAAGHEGLRIVDA